MLIGSRQRLSQVSADPILSMGSEGIKRVLSPKMLGVVPTALRLPILYCANFQVNI